MADVTLNVSAVESTPLDYPVPGAAELVIKMLSASYNGSGAAGSWVPAVELLVAGTIVAGTFPLGESLAAGASADVSWFPDGGVESSSSTAAGVWQYATPVAPATAPPGAVAGVAFQNGWANVQLSDGSYSPLLYRKEPGSNAARLFGAIGGGSFGQAALQLPAGYLPTADILKVVAGVNTTSGLTCSLNSNGILTPIGPIGGGLTLIYSSTLAVNASSIDTGAGGIPAGHGELLCFFTVPSTALGNSVFLTFNNDTGANYNWSAIRNNGANVASALSGGGATSATIGQTGNTTTPGMITFTIPGYDQTVLQKVGAGGSGPTITTGSSLEAWATAFTWLNTAAITRLAVTAAGGNFAPGARLAIYGTQ